MANMQVSSTFKESDLVFYSSEEDMDIGAQCTIWSSLYEPEPSENEAFYPPPVRGSPQCGNNQSLHGEQTDTDLEDTSQDSNDSLDCISVLDSADEYITDTSDGVDEDSSSSGEYLEYFEEEEEENEDLLEHPGAFRSICMNGQTEIEIISHMRVGGIEILVNHGSFINDE